MISAEKILHSMEYIEGVIKLGNGMILIHDLDKFLSIEEEKKLADAMQETGSVTGEKRVRGRNDR
jgi:purine-binding chemotaxis protein CheW